MVFNISIWGLGALFGGGLSHPVATGLFWTNV